MGLTREFISSSIRSVRHAMFSNINVLKLLVCSLFEMAVSIINRVIDVCNSIDIYVTVTKSKFFTFENILCRQL